MGCPIISYRSSQAGRSVRLCLVPIKPETNGILGKFWRCRNFLRFFISRRHYIIIPNQFPGDLRSVADWYQAAEGSHRLVQRVAWTRRSPLRDRLYPDYDNFRHQKGWLASEAAAVLRAYNKEERRRQLEGLRRGRRGRMGKEQRRVKGRRRMPRT